MRRKILILGGLMLIAAALGLTADNLIEADRAANSAQEALLDVNTLIAEVETEAQAEIPDSETEMPTVESDGNEYIGVLEIPAFEISLPVMSDWSYAKLKQAPCRYKGSAYLQNLIIAGHNYSHHFGKLKDLNSGDEIFFTDADGNRFRYIVSEIELLDGFATEEMETGDWDLTLFTCTIGGRNRVTVRCSQADSEET